EGLRAVHDVFAVLAARKGLEPGDVRAAARLRDRKSPDLLALDSRHDPALLLLLGAELEDGRHRDGDVATDTGRDSARPAARHLLGEHSAVDAVAALAPVLLRVADAQEAELPHAREQLPWELAGLLPPRHVRPDLARDERAQRLAQRLVLIGERRDGRHARTRSAASGPAPSRVRTSSHCSSVVWPRPAWSNPSRFPCLFLSS